MTVPIVVDGQLIETTWGNQVANQINSGTTQAVVANQASLATFVAPDGSLAYQTDMARLWLRMGGAWRLIGGSMPRAEVYRTAAFSFPNATNATIPWDGERVDTDAMHDNATNPHRLTIPAGIGGRWRFDTSVTFDGAVAGIRVIWFEKNSAGSGTRYWTEQNEGSATQGSVPTNLSLELVCAAGDYVCVCGFHNAGSALNVGTNTTSQGFNAVYMGPV